MKHSDATTAKRYDERGEHTKAVLIDAAISLFGEYGFKSTTTRMLANKSGANIAAIAYYFGGKKGLYHAVIHHIMAQIAGQLKKEVPDLEKLMDRKTNDIGHAEALTSIKAITGAMINLLIQSDQPKRWSQIIVREQANPTEAFDILYDGQIKKLQTLMSTLIGVCLGKSPAADEVKIIGHAIFGQIIGFVVSQETILRQLGTTTFSKHHAELIRQVLYRHIENCLQHTTLPTVE